jgi:hypothetical protein
MPCSLHIKENIHKSAHSVSQRGASYMKSTLRFNGHYPHNIHFIKYYTYCLRCFKSTKYIEVVCKNVTSELSCAVVVTIVQYTKHFNRDDKFSLQH